jgi:hypothetical protein
MPTAHATVTLPHRSGLARDNVINSFTFDSVDPLTADIFDEIRDALEEFYNATSAEVLVQVGRYINSSISRSSAPIVRIYDVSGHMSGAPAGSPVGTRAFAAALPSSASEIGLPNEAAVCLTMAADFGSDVEFGPGTRPRARDRARVYIGPLNVTAAQTTLGITRPDVDMRNNLAQSGIRLARRFATVNLVVWSRAAASTKTVTHVWVDDAFDSQRRRGERPTSRIEIAA